VPQLPDLAVVPGLRTERLRSASGSAHEDVVLGLGSKLRRLPSRLAYDTAGFELLERLWRTDGYYPARLERELLQGHAAALRERAGSRARIIEPWHGDIERTIRVLELLEAPAQYVPIDGDPVRLAATTQAVRAALPRLEVLPAVTVDEVPRTGGFERTIALLPGTTAGSLEPTHAVRLLTVLASLVGDHGGLVLGADATTDPAALTRAYRDAAAARWARHALGQLAHHDAAAVDVEAFGYECRWVPSATRLDLVLVARRATAIVVGGQSFELDMGEPIVVDHRYQHSTEAMHAMLGIAGWQATRVFTASPEPMRIWLCDRWRRSRRR
jgi:uncharacterized SAM-dependent methyltransferase